MRHLSFLNRCLQIASGKFFGGRFNVLDLVTQIEIICSPQFIIPSNFVLDLYEYRYILQSRRENINFEHIRFSNGFARQVLKLQCLYYFFCSPLVDGHRLGIKIGMVLFLANKNLAFFPIRVPISIRGRAKSVLSVNWFTSRRRREDKIFHFFTELWIRIRILNTY